MEDAIHTKPNTNLSRIAGWAILSSVFASILVPLTLSFLPALIGIAGLVLLGKNSLPRLPAEMVKNYALFLAIPALAVTSALWSITPADSFERGLKVFGEVLVSLSLFWLVHSLPETTLEFVKKYFYVPVILAGSLLSAEFAFGLPALHLLNQDAQNLHGWILNKNASVFTLFLPMAIYSIYTNKSPALYVAFAIPAIAVLLLTDSQSAQLASLVMIIAATLGYMSHNFLKLPYIAFLLLLFAMPWIASPMYHHLTETASAEALLQKSSFNARLEIWSFISEKIKENPLSGFGVDSTRAMTFDFPIVYHTGNTVLHPHNGLLQIWNDFGLIGATLVSILVAMIVARLNKTTQGFQILSTILFSGLSVFLLASWSIWASWLIGLICFISALTILFFRKTNLALENKR